MGARNMVVAGDYRGLPVSNINNCVQIYYDKKKYILLDKYEVERYEVLLEENQNSATNMAVRGAVGDAIFGEPGMLAGALSGKNKGIFTIAIYFKNGKKSLIEIDTKTYKDFIKEMF